jgi:S-formylglutathione hydrolase FrmB
VDYFGALTGKPGEESLTGLLDAAIAQAATSEMIVIVPEARNAYFGSFYANSELIGNWEDAIVREVVPWIDSRFRTIAAPDSRGIAGHSMGGYGAIMMAMKNPDVFGALFALSPCCIALIDDWGPENGAWSKALRMRSRDELNPEPQTFEELYPTIFIAMAAAFSPEPTGTGLRVRMPFAERAGQLIPDEPAYSEWKGAMPLYQVQRYQDRLQRLKGIYLDFGAREELTHIRSGTRMLSGELARLGIPHTFDIYAEGNHWSHLKKRIKSRVLPFFSEVLVGAECLEVGNTTGENRGR